MSQHSNQSRSPFGYVIILALVAIVVTIVFVVPREASNIVKSTVEVPQPNLDGVDDELVATFNQVREEVVREPDSADNWGAFAMLSDAHGLHDIAITAYERASRIDQTAFRWVYHHAYLLALDGKEIEKATQRMEEALRLNSDYAPAYVQLARLKTKLGKNEDAETAYRRALAIDSNLVSAKRGLGQLLLAIGNATEAVEYLEQAVAAKAVDRGTLSSLAQAYLRTGREAEADAVAIRSQSAPAEFRMPDPERENVDNLAVNPASQYARAKELLDNGQFAQAVVEFDTVQEMLPRDPYAPLFQAVAYLRLGDFEKSKSAFEKSVARESELESADQAYRLFKEALWDYRTQFLGAAWYKATPDVVQNTLAEFSRLAASEPEYVSPRGFLTWGTTLCRLGRLEEGLAKFQEAARRDPQYEKAYYNIGATLEELGRPEDAVPYYQKAAEINPTGNSATRLSQLLGG
ncbi:MAG: tetratricopeptide repeat protein [Phycisphaerae bacterium]